MSQLPRYESYKDSGVQWLGKIPSHWVQMSLKFSLDMPITDGPHETPEILTEGIPFISAEAVKNDKLDFNKKRGYISEEDDLRFSKKYKPKFGDVYMVKSGATTGNVAKVETHEHFNIWSPLAVMRPDLSKITTEYIFYTLKSDYFNHSVKTKWNMGTQQNIGMGVIANIPIIVPPVSEQKIIADFLDKRLAQVDALIAKQETLLEKLAEQRVALISHAVTKGLNPDVEMKDSGVQWLGEIPNHWKTTRIKFLGDIVLGLTYSPEDVTTGESGTLVLRSSNVQNGVLTLDDNVYVEKNIPKKMVTTDQDILICSRNGSRALIGKCALIEGEAVGQAFGAFMTVLRSPYRKYLYYVLSSDLFKYQIGSFLTSTINQLTTYALGNFEIAFPSVEEQKQITDYLDQELAEIEKVKDNIVKTLQTLQEYRSTLITQVVTGKIDVRNLKVN